MLRSQFYVPSDKYQSALRYDALFNIHYAMLVLLCVYILNCIVQYRYFRYAMVNNLCAMMRLLQAYCCIQSTMFNDNVSTFIMLCSKV